MLTKRVMMKMAMQIRGGGKGEVMLKLWSTNDLVGPTSIRFTNLKPSLSLCLWNRFPLTQACTCSH